MVKFHGTTALIDEVNDMRAQGNRLTVCNAALAVGSLFVAASVSSSMQSVASGSVSDATFVATESYPIGDLTSGIAAGDMDGDGHIDLAVANPFPNDIALLRNLGDGTFGDEQHIPSPGGQVRDVALADLDGDGHLDLVASLLNGPSTLVAWPNDGAGGLGPPLFIGPSSPAFSFVVTDLDLDGSLDIAVATLNASFHFSAAVFMNDGGGAFTVAFHELEAHNQAYFCDLAAGDVDGDALPDLVGINQVSGGAYLLVNLGGGVFAAPRTLVTGAMHPFGVALDDLDGDQMADLILLDIRYETPETLVIALSDGAGSFIPLPELPVAHLSSAATPTGLGVADFNGDGRGDVVATNRVFINLGDGNFKAVTIGTGDTAFGTVTADIDGDGDVDIVHAGHSYLLDSFVAVLRNETIPVRTRRAQLR